MIKIRNHELEIDVMEEISEYQWDRARPRTGEFTACSPFRSDGSPSFSISTETGQWIDFGASNDLYSKGSLVLLLSFLREETTTEVEDYLIDKYGIDLTDAESLELNIDLSETKKEPRIISIDEYKRYAYKHPYLGTRKISDKVQRAFKTGFDRGVKAVALAWHDKDGNIINVKFRSIKSKQFYYFEGGQELRNHIYGLHFIYRMNCKRVYIVESEIDCLFLWSCGLPCIALGGSKLSDARKKLLLRSPIETLVIATDNDAVGEEVKQKIVKATLGYKNLEEIHLPLNVKDVNELTPEEVIEIDKNATPLGFSFM
ncbi:toprim domain-containing protein [Priestia megaterium]